MKTARRERVAEPAPTSVSLAEIANRIGGPTCVFCDPDRKKGWAKGAAILIQVYLAGSGFAYACLPCIQREGVEDPP